MSYIGMVILNNSGTVLVLLKNMYLYSLDREGLWIFFRIHIGQSQQPKSIRILLNSLRTAHNISTTLGYFSKSYPKWNFFDSCARRTR